MASHLLVASWQSLGELVPACEILYWDSRIDRLYVARHANKFTRYDTARPIEVLGAR